MGSVPTELVDAFPACESSFERVVVAFGLLIRRVAAEAELGLDLSRAVELGRVRDCLRSGFAFVRAAAGRKSQRAPEA